MTDPRSDANAALEHALDKISALMIEAGEVVTDAGVLIGSQVIDADGDRIGGVSVFPRHGAQPTYISLGLIEAARVMLSNELAER